jgi:heme exporter protein C
MKNRLAIFRLFTAALLGYGMYQALMAAPTERTMGDVQRIFYIHVPSAWVAFLCFFGNFIASIVYLKNRSQSSDAFAVSAAEVGVIFCTVNLVTGPIWAKPVWGIWWTWDVRLTTTLVLWLIYVAYLVLRRFAAGGQTQVVAAVLGVFGFIDVPLVYLSIRFFRTQHPQPVIAGGEGSGLAPAILYAFLINLAAFTAYGGLLLWIRYRMEGLRRDFEDQQALKAIAGAHAEGAVR